jgi:hypothetical protein
VSRLRQECQDCGCFPDNPACAYVTQSPFRSLFYFLDRVRARVRKQDCQDPACHTPSTHAAQLERLADLVRCLTPGEHFEAERQHIEHELRRLIQEARA